MSIFGSGHEVVTSTTRPATPSVGQTIFETNTGLFKFWNGSAWVNGQGTPPSLTTTQKTALTDVITGTMVYDSTLGLLQVWNGTVWLAASGLVPVASGTITMTGAVNNITLQNVFSSNYKFHKVVLAYAYTGAAGGKFGMRMALGSTPATTSSYWNAMEYSWSGGSATNLTTQGTFQGGAVAYVNPVDGTGGVAGEEMLVSFDIMNAATARATYCHGQTTYRQSNNAVGLYQVAWSWIHTVATAYDGLDLYFPAAAAAASGSYRVYGYA